MFTSKELHVLDEIIRNGHKLYSTKNYQSPLADAIDNLELQGLVRKKDLEWGIVVKLTEQGETTVKQTDIDIIEVHIPDNGWYHLLDTQDLSMDIMAGYLSTSFEVLEDYPIGAEIFTVKRGRMNLWDFASAEEWEPV